MAASSTSPTLSSVRCVAVPVTDLDRGKALFSTLGLVETMDAELQPGFRWIELAPPGLGAGPGAALALVLAGPELPAGIDTGIRLTAPDARVAHATVADLGLAVGDLLDWPGVPLMFHFEDHDGNRFYVSEEG